MPKILLTGATGYIGGTILHHLLTSTNPSLTSTTVPTISCLVRGTSAAEKLTATYGTRVNPILFRDLNDTATITKIASEHDIIVSTWKGDHPACAAALVHGLAQRRKSGNGNVYIIHTSGTSNLADQPITGTAHPDRIFSDDSYDVYDFEKTAEWTSTYAQRETELGVIDIGLAEGVKTLVIMSPLIYGLGSGTAHRASIQIPMYLRATLEKGHGIVIGDGAAVWDHVHVEDLAVLYELAVADILKTGGANLPQGKKSIIFSANGEHAWKSVAQGVADAAHKLGAIKSNEVKGVGIQAGADALIFGSTAGAEGALSSNSRTRSNVARDQLGWRPTRGEDAWHKNFEVEVKAYLDGLEGILGVGSALKPV